MLNAASSFNLYCLKTIEVQWPIAISPSAMSIYQYCWIARILSLNTQLPVATSTAKL